MDYIRSLLVPKIYIRYLAFDFQGITERRVVCVVIEMGDGGRKRERGEYN